MNFVKRTIIKTISDPITDRNGTNGNKRKDYFSKPRKASKREIPPDGDAMDRVGPERDPERLINC